MRVKSTFNEFGVKALIEALRKSETFDQRIYYQTNFDKFGRWCNTPACIAGHAYFLSKGFGSSSVTDRISNVNSDLTQIWVTAKKYLGLSNAGTMYLFDEEPLMDVGGCPLQPDNLDAIQVLEHLLETGEVDWSQCDTYHDWKYGVEQE